MQFLARFSIARRALTALITAAIAILGVISLGSLRLELIPSTSFPVAVVIGVYPGASPEVVEQQVTEVIEGAVLGVDGIENLSSTAASNVSTTTIEFEFGTNLTTAVADLRSSVAAVEPQLPEDLEQPTIFAGSLDDFPVLQLAVAGGQDAAALADTVETILVPELADLAGVRSVDVAGQAPREIHLDVDLQAMTLSGLSPDRILEILDDYGVRLPGGTITENEQTVSVQVGTPLESVDDLRNIPLTDTTTLGDIAEVVDGEAAAQSFSRLNGETSLSVSITKVPDATVVEVSEAVTETLADLSDRLEAQGVEAAIVFDQAPFIEESIEGLATEGLLGLGFAIIIILLFLTSVRSTLVSAVSIPLSLLTAFIVMLGVSYSLNLLTLAALTISIGRVVDDAIVVIENISRHLSYGEPRKQAILTATKEVGGAITSATLATVAVFAPIGFVGGFVGELFRPFAVTVAIAMLASLFVALTIVPVLAYWFLKTPKADAEAAAARERAEAKERHGIWQRVYLPTLAASLRRPVITLGIAVALLGGSLAFIPQLETNFIGDSGQNTLQVTQTFEPATSLAAQDEAAREVEEALMALDEVDTVQANVGQGTGLAAFGGAGTSASFALTLTEDADGTQAQEQVRDAVADLVQAPVTGITVSAGETGFGSSTVDLIVTADDADVLAEAAEMVAEAAGQAEGTTDLTSSLAEQQPVIQITVDRDAAAAAGLTETEVAGTVAGLMYNAEIGTITLDGVDVPVTAAFGSSPATVAELSDVVVNGSDGSAVLSEVATIETVDAPASITRNDGRRTVTVSVTPAIEDLGALTSDLTIRMDELDLPVGATVEIGGVAADQADAFADLGMALVAAIMIVYIVLVATFNSLAQPLILLVSIPFAAIGAIAALLLTSTPLGVPALIGLLMLVGVVVSNAIVLIDLINQYRARGMPLEQAVTEGSRKRLRPILMTAAATIFALLPMAFGITGGGAFISQPLAIVVIGGLLTSTLLTLIVVPVIYAMGQRRSDRRRQRREARRGTSTTQSAQTLAANPAGASASELQGGATTPAPAEADRPTPARHGRHAANPGKS
ncbi:MAG: efflux RND transporter permease subunit [Beutenbergiaceae bacterium]